MSGLNKDIAPMVADELKRYMPDLVELVRCKDCKHRDPEDKKCDCGHGIMWQLPRDDNWFCADGKENQ